MFRLDVAAWYGSLRDIPSPLPTSIPVMSKRKVCVAFRDEHSRGGVSHNEQSQHDQSQHDQSQHNQSHSGVSQHNQSQHNHPHKEIRESERGRIDAFYSSNVCVFCGRVEGGREWICSECARCARRGSVRRRHPCVLLATVEGWIRDVERSVSVSERDESDG